MQDIEIVFAFLERFWAKGYAYESAATTPPGELRFHSRGWKYWAGDSKGRLPSRDRKARPVCMRLRDKVRLAWRESFAQGVCTYSQKRRRPEGRTYRRRFVGKILEVAATRILVGWRAPRLIPRHVSCFPICKKYNFAAKITRNLGTSPFSLFPHKIQCSKYLAQWSLECFST